MKRTILAVLMAVMIATPCLAQEIEPDGLFSLEGTTWRRIGVAIGFIAIDELPHISLYDDTVYFTEQSVLTSSGNIGILSNVSTYLDFLVFSVAWEGFVGFMILQPTIGVGVYSLLVWSIQQQYQPEAMNTPQQAWPPLNLGLGLNFGFMFKIDDDDWTPPDEE